MCYIYRCFMSFAFIWWTKQAGMMNEEHHRAHEHGEYHVTWCALFFGGEMWRGLPEQHQSHLFFVLVEEGQEKKKPIELLVRSLGMTWHQPGCLPRISLFGGTAHCQWMFDDVCCFRLVLGSNRIIMNHSLFGSTQPYKHTNHIWHHDISSLKLPLLRIFCFSAIHFGFPQLPTVFHRVSWEPFTTSSGASEPAWRTAEAPLAGHQNWTAAPWRFVRSHEKSWKVWGGTLRTLF